MPQIDDDIKKPGFRESGVSYYVIKESGISVGRGRKGKCVLSVYDGDRRITIDLDDMTRRRLILLLCGAMNPEERMPLLKCYQTPAGSVKAWCPFCRKWHIHGFAEKVERACKIGHWIAHCTEPKSPFLQTGYELTLMTKEEMRRIGAGVFSPEEET